MNGNEDFLIHYGIKGQKWGVRRFQNEDRTLTAAGKERYGRGDGSSFGKKMKKAASSVGSGIGKAAKAIGKRAKNAAEEKWKENPKHLSDDELQERINRLNKEAQYKRLQDELNRKPSKNQNGQGGGKGGKGKKHPYLALALLTPVATAIGVGTKAITAEKVGKFLEKRANKAISAQNRAMQSGASMERIHELFETARRAANTYNTYAKNTNK